MSTRVYKILQDTAKEYEVPLTQALNLLIFDYPIFGKQAVLEQEIERLKKKITKLTQRIADLEKGPKELSHSYVLSTREKEVRP